MYSPLFVTLMGIGTVFFGLVCIIVLTTIMGAVLKSNAKPAPAPAAAPKAAAPAVNTAKEQEILAAVIAAVTEDLGPSASRMQITSINKI